MCYNATSIMVPESSHVPSSAGAWAGGGLWGRDPPWPPGVWTTGGILSVSSRKQRNLSPVHRLLSSWACWMPGWTSRRWCLSVCNRLYYTTTIFIAIFPLPVFLLSLCLFSPNRPLLQIFLLFQSSSHSHSIPSQSPSPPACPAGPLGSQAAVVGTGSGNSAKISWHPRPSDVGAARPWPAPLVAPGAPCLHLGHCSLCVCVCVRIIE